MKEFKKTVKKSLVGARFGRVKVVGRGSFVDGVRAAAAVADGYNDGSAHDFRLGDCILAKLNLLQRLPRKNPHAGAQFYQGYAAAAGALARSGDKSGARDLLRNDGITIADLKRAKVDPYDLKPLARAVGKEKLR